MSSKEKNNSKDNGLKNYVKFSGFAIQMGATIFAGAYLGKYLDEKYPADKKWFTMVFTLVGVGLSLYVLLKQLNNAEKK